MPIPTLLYGSETLVKKTKHVGKTEALEIELQRCCNGSVKLRKIQNEDTGYGWSETLNQQYLKFFAAHCNSKGSLSHITGDEVQQGKEENKKCNYGNRGYNG
jgi:hypothetical protein